jgi:hypothetical protein
MKLISLLLASAAISVAPAWGQTNYTFGPWSSGTYNLLNAPGTAGDWTVTAGSIKVDYGYNGVSGWTPPIVGTVTIGLDGTSEGTVQTMLNLNGPGFSGGGSQPLTFASDYINNGSGPTIADVSASETGNVVDVQFWESIEPGNNPPQTYTVDLGGFPGQTITDPVGPTSGPSMDWTEVNVYFTETATGAPDGGETAMLLGVGLAGLAWLRRFGSKK